MLFSIIIAKRKKLNLAIMGTLILLVPIIGYLTKWLTFGYDFGKNKVLIITLLNTFFYWGLATFFIRIFCKRWTKKRNLPQLIQNAFSITQPILVAILGVIIIFSLNNLGNLIYPIVLVLLGIMYSVFGKFSLKTVLYLAYSHIVLGLLDLYISSKYDISYQHFIFMAYQGISYIIMAYLFYKNEKRLENACS